MKTTNTINNTNIRNINCIAEENLKKAIFAAAKASEPSAEQIAKDKKWCEEGAKHGRKRTVEYCDRDWYKKLMESLEISEEYRTGRGHSEIDIVESIFRLTEHEEKFSFGSYRSRRRYYNEEKDRCDIQDNFYDECMKLITDAGLASEYNAWLAERQVHDRNGQVIRIGDIIRFPDITEVCGSPVENGFESRVDMTDNGLVWIAYPEKAWFGYNGEPSEHLHIPAVPLTAELAKSAEVIIKREEGFVRHPHLGDFILPRIHVPASEKPQIFVKKA